VTRTALDSNVLIYGEADPDLARGAVAEALIPFAAASGILPAQALAEYLWVIWRKRPERFPGAVLQASLYRETFEIVGTDSDLVLSAAQLTRRHRMQFWDAIICAAAMKGGAEVLLTEDLQDGSLIEGLRVLNPFALENRAELQRIFPGVKLPSAAL
jgi:predicted nucleic acid-binding protein